LFTKKAARIEIQAGFLNPYNQTYEKHMKTKTKIISVKFNSKFFLEKVWGIFTHLNRNFVSSVFLVIVCVAPLILRRGFFCGHTLVGVPRALRGVGFFGVVLFLYGVGCFFAIAESCGKLCR
jgi:hypothetical protein